MELIFKQTSLEIHCQSFNDNLWRPKRDTTSMACTELPAASFLSGWPNRPQTYDTMNPKLGLPEEMPFHICKRYAVACNEMVCSSVLGSYECWHRTHFQIVADPSGVSFGLSDHPYRQRRLLKGLWRCIMLTSKCGGMDYIVWHSRHQEEPKWNLIKYSN